MKHYKIEDWVDFSRGIADTAEGVHMRSHLEKGCKQCQSLAGFTEKFAGACRGGASVEVPEFAMRIARAIFPVAAQRPRRGNRIPIELIFDSFLTPAPSGLRATWQVGWQGLYRAGECSVDLRIEPELKSSRAAVIGQIANHVAPGMEMNGLEVSLRAGREIVAETRSNRFGEFQMEYEQRAQLKLCIFLPDSRSILVPLKRFTQESPAVKSRTRSAKQSGEQC